MTETKNNKWDYFYDQFNDNKWDDEKVAELQRIYMKNSQPIYKHIREDSHDLDVVPYPISAKGITAFLADESLASFRYSRDKSGLNYGVGSHSFYKQYYNKRIMILRQKDNNSNVFEDERMSDSELIKAHLKEEQQLFNESELLFYSEEVLNDNIPMRDFINKAALKYLVWVKKTHLVEDDNNILNKSCVPELEKGSGIFVPKFNEEIIEDLFVKLCSYFEPQDLFKNFLTGNKIEGKINFTGNQNMLAGIFILSKEYSYVDLGTHQQTFDYIKQTFLIRGKPIATKQILTYLIEPGSIDKFGNLKDETKPGKANRKTFIDISI
ncbi:MAG TPA: hypothetical protein VFC65_16970 [Prolixibacteraceae bacterium]|nr:hypothetical protein [Prolixibacteraceae bacterium]